MTAPTPSTPTPSSKSSAELMAAFEAFARPLFEESGIPGVSIGVLLPDGDHILNLGVTSVENPLPINDDTLFQIGSNTKTLTSLTVSVLVAEGKLKLDDTVRTHLPDFKLKDDSVAAAVTVRDLLTHQGGFQGDLFEDTGDGDDALAKILDILAESPQVVPLRGHWSYNNAGFYVAGRVIEAVTGQTYEAAVTDRVFKPLGMDHSLFFPNQIMTYRFAAGHNFIDEQMQIQRPWLMMRSSAPAGGTCTSTVTDMLRYAHYILDGALPAPAGKTEEPDQAETSSTDTAAPDTDFAPILSALDRQNLWTPQLDIGISINGFSGDQGRMGQSWFNDPYPQATIISHGGTTIGHQSDFWLSPDRKVGFIALTNANKGHAFNRKLSDWIKREVLGLSASERPEHTPNSEALAEPEGFYLRVGQPTKLSLGVNDGTLELTIPDDTTGGTLVMPLQFISPTTALIREGEVKGYAVEFLRNSSGQIDFIRFAGRLYPREMQTSATQSSEVEPQA
jgi:CubicO group peptidase (beta-lactamase class C family)